MIRFLFVRSYEIAAILFEYHGQFVYAHFWLILVLFHGCRADLLRIFLVNLLQSALCSKPYHFLATLAEGLADL